MSDVTTVDHKASHVWTRTSIGVRCAYQWCNAKPTPAEVAKLEAEEVQRRAMRIEIRFSH